MKKSQKSDAAEGNVTTIDFGEKIDSVIRDEALRLAGKGRGKGDSGSRTSRFSPGYRPGMYGGYRPGMSGYKPWYASRMGAGESKLGSLLRLPEGLKEKSKELFTGGLIGTAGNRVLAWVTPGILGTQNKLAVEAVSFGVTLIPYVVKQNATTFGIALPGFFFFVGALAEEAIGATNLLGPKPNLSGKQVGHQQRPQHSHQEAVLAARRKLAEAQARMQRPAPGQRPVMARPRAVAS